MSEGGINKTVFATDYLEGDPFDICTIDIMHLFLCGITRKELAWLLKILIPKYTTWDEVNAAICQLHLPRGKHISKLCPPRIGKKARDHVVDLNAAETMFLAIHSVTILEPLLSAEARALPCWQCWLKHRQVLAMCLEHNISLTEADAIEKCYAEYLLLFTKVYEYRIHLIYTCTYTIYIFLCICLHAGTRVQRIPNSQASSGDAP